MKQEGTCSCPDCFLEDLSFACLALKLKHQFLSQGPAIFGAEIYAISSSDIRPVDSDWSYTIGSPGSPARRLQIMELLSLPNHMSQFLLRNLSVYTYSVGLFLWRTLTNTPLHIPISNSPLTYTPSHSPSSKGRSEYNFQKLKVQFLFISAIIFACEGLHAKHREYRNE